MKKHRNKQRSIYVGEVLSFSTIFLWIFSPPKCSFWMPWQYRSHFFGMRKFCRSSRLREHLLRCAKTVQFLLGVIKPQVGMGWREVLFWLNHVFFLGVSTKKRRTQNLDFPQNFHKIRSFLAGLVIFWWFWQDLCPPSILGVSSSWCIFWRVLSSSESSWYGFLSVGWNLARVTLVDKVW